MGSRNAPPLVQRVTGVVGAPVKVAERLHAVLVTKGKAPGPTVESTVAKKINSVWSRFTGSSVEIAATTPGSCTRPISTGVGDGSLMLKAPLKTNPACPDPFC